MCGDLGRPPGGVKFMCCLIELSQVFSSACYLTFWGGLKGIFWRLSLRLKMGKNMKISWRKKGVII